MKSCNNSKYNCGQILPSSCVPFTGDVLTFPATPDALTCDANINDVIFVIDKYLKVLVDGNNLTGLNKNCLDFVPATVTPAQLHQIEIDQICLLKGQTEALQTQFDDFNIGAHTVDINLPTCLLASAAACLTGINTYQLIALLNLYAAKICDLETRISNLES